MTSKYGKKKLGLTKADLQSMVDDGMSQEQIGRELDRHYQTVRSYGKRLGVKFWYGRKKEYRRAQVISAIQKGCRNSVEIGKMIGIHKVQAHRYVRELCNLGILKLTGRSKNTRITITGKWTS